MRKLTEIEISNIREAGSDINWKALCKSFYLSESFIIEFQDKINMHWILYNQNKNRKRLINNSTISTDLISSNTQDKVLLTNK